MTIPSSFDITNQLTTTNMLIQQESSLGLAPSHAPPATLHAVHDPGGGFEALEAPSDCGAIENHRSPKEPRSHEIPQTETSEGGEAGALQVSNADFVAAVFSDLPEAAFAAVCTKSGDPTVGGWVARRADQFIDKLSADDNNYIGCSSYYPGNDGSVKAVKAQFAACHFLLLDDLGSKVPMEQLAPLPLSFLIETSPGNYQGGIILSEPITDGDVVIRLLNAIIAKGLCDAGSTGPLSRWARLPVASNCKPRYTSEGEPFKCRLRAWQPDRRYAPEDIVERLQLELAPAGRPKKPPKPSHADAHANSSTEKVLTPRAAENPVVAALKARGLYKRSLGSGKHDITCPWASEHTDAIDNGSAYFEPSELSPVGGYCCQHSHRETYRISQLLRHLGVSRSDARDKPVIRVTAGDLDIVVDAAERVLADLGTHYQSGGSIVTIETDPVTGDSLVVQTNAQSLARALCKAAIWEKPDSDGCLMAVDPPERHVNILSTAKGFAHLPPLAGLARQPYLRESDGVLVAQPGYDETSHLFGVFDPAQFPIGEPTLEAAQAALQLLMDPLVEFPFVDETDRAAALSAIFTGVVRQSVSHAPGFHVRAPVIASGKSYLCEVIGACASGADNKKMSYPVRAEEATKAILAALLENPAVIEFDDMTTDWISHGAINRLLTASHMSDRLLGYSKVATVSTRVLVLGSGNNVGPTRDLSRRVLTVHLDPRCATPATKQYKARPLDKVRSNRGAYVGAVLCVIGAWRQAGSPRTNVPHIATYGGAWADHCRHPLIWLGLPDPATALLEQLTHDPDTEALSALLVSWRAAFGAKAMTIRKVLEASEFQHPDLYDAMREFQLEERGQINRSKLGWLLKRHEDRIVSGLRFQKTTADGRTAWRVIAVDSPPSPPSPPSVIASASVPAALGAPELHFSHGDVNQDDDSIPF
jgi:hypothetical protein